MRVAILDDYQRVALASADWSGVRELAGITVFTEHIPRTEALVSALEPFDVVVAMRERTAFDSERLSRLPRLRLLVTTGMSNASIDLAAASSLGVTVCGTEGSPTATAELTWGLILALARHIPEEDRRMKLAAGPGGAALGSGWQHTVGTGLAGKKLGIVGLGRQGAAVAGIARAFGMKRRGWSQNLDPSVARAAHVKPVSKEELFATCDIVTVHYKFGPRSVGLVGAAELALMKRSAFLVNTSRGPIVDSAALLAALRSGAIAGAALDVYDVEPLPLSDQLRGAPNVVLTPHLGYVTDDTYRTFYGDAAQDIMAFTSGTPVRVLLPRPLSPRG
jgi:phosphoglycerate dehydrogenase-like enzyme